MINKNKLAVEIARREGGSVNLPIAQIKEVLSITLMILSQEKPSEVLKLLGK